ncbi:MAG: protein rep [Candidatus Nanoarchaeia archaeon]|nr:protein rep [Candidatus Nanoarchaeia archaeon]
MIRCGELTGFRFIKHCDCQTNIIPTTHHCSLRTCPTCSKIRKRRIVNKYLPLLEGLHQDRKYFLYFLTISPKNYESLEEGLTHIKKSLSKFLRHKYITDRIKAGLYVIEAKGTEGNWNIHIHSIIYGRYIDNKVRTKKNSKIVDLFRESSGREVNIHITKQSSTKFTLNYMCKYISANKDDFKTELDMAKYILASRKRRLIHTFGDFYKIKIISRKQICPICKQPIEYILDFEIVSIIEESMIRTKPPPDMLDWIAKNEKEGISR